MTTPDADAGFAAEPALEVRIGVALQEACRAQAEWRTQPVNARVAWLGRFHATLFARRAEVVRQVCEETGKAHGEALVAEVATALDQARFIIRAAPTLLAPQRLRVQAPALWRKRLMVSHEPFGVVAVISPWNYPFMLPVGVVLPLLVTGNAVILKPSELTPGCANLIGSLLAESGLPRGLFHVLHGDGSAGRALVRAPVDKVFFTGSVRAGIEVAKACAQRLVPCSLELGGSDPAIVLEDANIAAAARGIVWGRFANAGQTCVAPKRVYAVGKSYEPLVAALQREIAALRLRGTTDGTYDMAGLISAQGLADVRALCEDAEARGSQAIVSHAAPPAGGAGFVPTLLLNVPPEARVLTEETFGPVLPVVRVGSVEQAITWANASAFGLSASVWSRSRAAARAVAERLEAGSVALNDVALVAGVAEIPHGGVKHSGFGRSHGLAGLSECVRTKTIVDDLIATRGQPWWFPYSRAWERDLDGYVRFAHGRTLRERLGGVLASLRLLSRR